MQGNENLTNVLASWRPRSSRAPAESPADRWLRIALLAFVLLVHAWIIIRLPAWDDPGRSEEGSALLVDFIARPPDPVPIILVRMPRASSGSPAKTVARRPVPSPVASAAATPAKAAPAMELELYERDGRLRLPDEVMAEVDRRFGDKRQFEFQVPGLEDGKKLLDRPPALTYEATRFAQYYQPNRDLLTDILTRAVDATTKQVTLPMPGHPGKKIVCTVSLLALGGGCGIADNRNGYYVKGDDPNTLNAEEERQCQAWWEKIVGATTQETWRQTRSLYEQQCRKPLERKPPSPREVSTGQ